MFDRKKLKDTKKEMSKKDDVIYDSDDNALIIVKATENEQIFSDYDYDINEKLNDEFAEYIWDKAKFVPAKNDIRIKIFANSEANEKEIENAIHNKYKKEYLELRGEQKRNTLFSLSLFFAGLFALTVMFLSYSFLNNEFLNKILEIVVWVFIWGSVDSFFLKRSALKHQQFIVLKLCASTVQVIKVKEKK